LGTIRHSGPGAVDLGLAIVRDNRVHRADDSDQLTPCACCSNASTPCPTGHHGRYRAAATGGGPNPRREVPPPAAESLAPAAHRSEPERAAGFGEKLALDGRRGLATLAIRLPEQAHRQLDLSLGQRLALQWLVGLRAGQTERPGSVVAHGKY
jgi:hypothetical protein